MKTIYIENSYLCNEKNWPLIENFLNINKHIRLVLSDWTLVEIAQATDYDQAIKRLSFIDKFSPLWLINKISLHKFEVKSFLYKNRYGSIAPYSYYVSSFTDALSLYLGYKTDLTPITFVESCMDKKDTLNPIYSQKDIYIETYKTLLKIDKKIIKEKDNLILALWLEDVLPNFFYNGELIPEKEKQDSIAFCVQHKKLFLKECPYFNFENSLFEKRYNDKLRNPRKSDAIDLEHLCAAIPYCNYIVTNDLYWLHMTEKISFDLNMAQIKKCITELNLIPT